MPCRMPWWRMRLLAALATILLLMGPLFVSAAGGTDNEVAGYSGLSADQHAVLSGIARDTWTFYSADVDSNTHLPMDNITLPNGTRDNMRRGTYTSAANIGVYLWALVAAHDLGLVSRPQARSLLEATLHEVSTLKRFSTPASTVPTASSMPSTPRPGQSAIGI